MTFQQLIMCVDNSASMAGPKIRNAMNQLNSIASSLGCDTKYFRFGMRVEKISGFNTGTLPCNDFTAIAACLTDLYNNKLRPFRGRTTKFIFVTDAVDSIPNVNAVIAAKRNCESAYSSQLSSYCILVGPGGGCSKELEQIFPNAFDHVDGHKFESELQNMSGSFQEVAQQHQKSVDVATQVQSMTKSTNQTIREVGVKSVKIFEKVETHKQITAEVWKSCQQTTRNLAELDQKKQFVTRRVHSDLTDAQADRVEDSVEALKDGYAAESHRMRDAEGELNKGKQILQDATGEANQLAQKLMTSTNKMDDQAKVVISNIIQSLKGLEKMHKSCQDEAAKLKKQFRKDMDDLMEVVEQNDVLMKELRTIQKDITNAFKDHKKKNIEVADLRSIVRQKISEVNDLLEHLDDR